VKGRLNMKKLSEVKKGEKGKITSLRGDSRFLSRITSIGLTVGSEIEVKQNQKKQPVLVYGRDTMIAVNQDECEKIIMEVSTK
jgi:ferrous iron transport protein A